MHFGLNSAFIHFIINLCSGQHSSHNATYSNDSDEMNVVVDDDDDDDDGNNNVDDNVVDV